MGSGHWFKTIASFKKLKLNSAKQLKKNSVSNVKGSTGRNRGVVAIQDKNLAATHIQTAFRAYLARKILRCMKRTIRIQTVTRNHSVKKQAMTTLGYLHSWSNIQAHIVTRRNCMVREAQLQQKKLEDTLKLDAKLHDLEVEWCGGFETMEGTLAKIHQREEASVKRERAMAYAFSHQWRANSSQYLGIKKFELDKDNWGWSWKDRWIAARPWEILVPPKPSSPKKLPNKQPNNNSSMNTSSPAKKPLLSHTIRTPVKKTSLSPKLVLSNRNGNGIAKARRLSYPPSEKPAKNVQNAKAEEEIPRENTVHAEVRANQ